MAVDPHLRRDIMALGAFLLVDRLMVREVCRIRKDPLLTVEVHLRNDHLMAALEQPTGEEWFQWRVDDVRCRPRNMHLMEALMRRRIPGDFIELQADQNQY